LEAGSVLVLFVFVEQEGLKARDELRECDFDLVHAISKVEIEHLSKEGTICSDYVLNILLKVSLEEHYYASF
jgi:hypothetical protein